LTGSDMPTPAAGQGRFTAGLDDAVILPLVLIACLATLLCQAALVILAVAFDLVSALLLGLMTLLLRAAVAAGDGMAWLIKRLTPAAPGRDLMDRRWSGLRQRMSSAAVAATARRALREAMAPLFRRCGALSPGIALLVIAGAMLWLPLSAAISLGMHAVLLAKAASLPAWAQLLHPVATVIAKSKILLVPVYPAAWPQARKHAWVEAAFRCSDRVATLACAAKTAHRYRQVARALSQAGNGLRRKVSAARS
jgi:hypothetical protein